MFILLEKRPISITSEDYKFTIGDLPRRFTDTPVNRRNHSLCTELVSSKCKFNYLLNHVVLELTML